MAGEDQKTSIGVVVVSHCRVAEEMLHAAELIVGPLKEWRAVSTQTNQQVEEMVEGLRETIKEVDQGKGVLILTDLLGGTAANISISFLSHRVEVLCGMNLPMLIKVAQCQRDCDLADVAKRAKEYGLRHIFLASESLSVRMNP